MKEYVRIYALIDPDTHIVGYVGATARLRNRIHRHCTNDTIRIGKRPLVVVLECLPCESRHSWRYGKTPTPLDREQAWIEYFNNLEKLHNGFIPVKERVVGKSSEEINRILAKAQLPNVQTVCNAKRPSPPSWVWAHIQEIQVRQGEFMIEEDYITVEEARQKLGHTRQWISSLVKRGKLEGKRDASGKLFVSLASIENYDNSDPGGRPRKSGRPNKRRKSVQYLLTDQ